eukprot:jgi/Galph1/155/GphlegSOOS_G4931.1
MHRKCLKNEDRTTNCFTVFNEQALFIGLLVACFLFWFSTAQGNTEMNQHNMQETMLFHRKMKQIGKEIFVDYQRDIVHSWTRQQQDGTNIIVLPLSYRLPLNQQSVIRNIIRNEQSRGHLLGNRQNVIKELKEYAAAQECLKPIANRLDDKRKSVQRYFEQVVLGDVPNVAEYYVSIQVEGESFYVQLDTGSSNLLVSTENCSNCQAKKKLSFGSLKTLSCSSGDGCCSSSSSCCSKDDPSLCGVFVEYGSGFASGVLVKGTVTLANMSVEATFGGTLNASSDFEPTAVSGILGMASSALACNPTCVTPLFDTIVQQKSIANVFSVLLNPSNGVLVLGGVDGSFYNGTMSYTDMPSNGIGYYQVNVENVQVNGSSMQQSAFTAIVDTGTTLVYLPSAVVQSLVTYFNKHYPNSIWNGSSSILIDSLSKSYISSLPNVVIALKNSVNVSIPPQSYMVPVGGGNYMFGIQSSGGQSAILGDVLLQNYYTVFDRVNSRIGFGNAVNVKNINLSNVPGAGNITLTSPSTSVTLPTYGIVLIVVGAVVAAGLLVMVVVLLVRRRRKNIPTDTNFFGSQPYGVYQGHYFYYR